jgi:peptidyl-prolyl cis-trans isomerase B (cyclophilin B)
MARRRPVALALILASLVAGGLATAAVAQDESIPPLGPPVATPIADPPAVPSGDGTGVRLTTALGDIVIGLFTESSPVAAENFLNLASAGFYDGTVFHRIVPGFVIQGGDPTVSGSGGPGYSTRDGVPANAAYKAGVVAMAKAGNEPPGTAGSQFFVVTGSDAGLTPDYALLGRVTKGMRVAREIGQLGDPASGGTGTPLQSVVIEKVIVSEH